MGRVVGITYPSGRSVIYSRDALGRISAITTKDNAQATTQTIVSNIQYHPYGGIASMDYGNGITQSYTYDLDGRLETVTATGIGDIRSEYYTYDLANNITGIADNLDAGKDRAYIYDPLNRLTDEGYVEGEKSYQYDAVGNRLQKTWIKTDQSQADTSYNYETTSNRLIEKNAKSWITDAAGNIISADDGQKEYTYNHANRLKTYGEEGELKATYFYNALGQRVRTAKSEDNLLHYDLGGQYLAETNIAANGTDIQSQIDYIYLDNMPVAQIVTTFSEGEVQSRTLTYLHADHLNTPRIGTDGNEVVVWRWDSDAFGQTAPDTDPDSDGEQTVVNLRFPGQIQGGEAQHYYNYFRDYDPSLGRYVQSDPIGLHGGLNTYAYVGGNPLMYNDPYGLWVNVAVGVGIRVIGGRAAGAVISRALKQSVGPVAGTALACILTGYCSEEIDDPADSVAEGGHCPPEGDSNQRGNPFNGEPGEWVEHPHGKQDRLYGNDGTPAVDIDYGHDHGQGSPHSHNWNDGIRGPGVPVTVIK